MVSRWMERVEQYQVSYEPDADPKSRWTPRERILAAEAAAKRAMARLSIANEQLRLVCQSGAPELIDMALLERVEALAAAAQVLRDIKDAEREAIATELIGSFWWNRRVINLGMRARDLADLAPGELSYSGRPVTLRVGRDTVTVHRPNPDDLEQLDVLVDASGSSLDRARWLDGIRAGQVWFLADEFGRPLAGAVFVPGKHAMTVSWLGSAPDTAGAKLGQLERALLDWADRLAAGEQLDWVRLAPGYALAALADYLNLGFVPATGPDLAAGVLSRRVTRPVSDGLAIRPYHQPGEDEPSPFGGPVPVHGWSPARNREAVARLTAADEGSFTPLEQLYPGLAARAPPRVRVEVFDGELPGAIAFGFAGRGTVVISRSMAAEIAEHIEAGRLTYRWWWRLLVHERDYHLPGGLFFGRHTDEGHRDNADPIAAEFRAARARAVSRSTGVRAASGSALARPRGRRARARAEAMERVSGQLEQVRWALAKGSRLHVDQAPPYLADTAKSLAELEWELAGLAHSRRRDLLWWRHPVHAPRGALVVFDNQQDVLSHLLPVSWTEELQLVASTVLDEPVDRLRSSAWPVRILQRGARALGRFWRELTRSHSLEGEELLGHWQLSMSQWAQEIRIPTAGPPARVKSALSRPRVMRWIALAAAVAVLVVMAVLIFFLAHGVVLGPVGHVVGASVGVFGAGVVRNALRGALSDSGHGGGAVADHDLSPEEIAAIRATLRAAQLVKPRKLGIRLPRGPPGVRVRVLDGEFPVAGVRAFGWADRTVVVISRAMAVEIARRHAIDPSWVADWWWRVLVHERDFHLGEHSEHTGERHRVHAEPLAAEWDLWTEPVDPLAPEADQVNRQRLARARGELVRWRTALLRRERGKPVRWADSLLWPRQGRLTRLLRAVNELSAYLNDPARTVPIRLLRFDLAAPGGHATFAVGDWEGANHIVPFIGGMTSGLRTSTLELAYAERLVAEAARRGENLLVIVFAYDAPQSLGPAVLPGFAVRGAAELRAFLIRLATARALARPDAPAVRYRAAAHSYGTVLAVHALPGTPVDRLVVLGSPGVPASHAAELEPIELVVAAHPFDPVAWAPNWIHGPNPSSPEFGARALLDWDALAGWGGLTPALADAHRSYLWLDQLVEATVDALIADGDQAAPPPPTQRGSSSQTVIQPPSYQPPWIFLGELPAEWRGRVQKFLGLEIEFEIDGRKQVIAAVLMRDRLGELGFVKKDSTVSGLELVTHPMTYPWGMEYFPWDLLTEVRELGATVHRGTGLHIHVNRDAFDSPEHIYRWLKFIYHNKAEVIRLARRENLDFASFEVNDRGLWNAAMGSYEGIRDSAVNTTGPNTFEARFFASSLNPAEVKAAFAFIAASIEYTRMQSMAEFEAGGKEWAQLVDWLIERPEYSPLIQEIAGWDMAEEAPELRPVVNAPTSFGDLLSALADNPGAGLAQLRGHNGLDDHPVRERLVEMYDAGLVTLANYPDNPTFTLTELGARLLRGLGDLAWTSDLPEGLWRLLNDPNPELGRQSLMNLVDPPEDEPEGGAEGPLAVDGQGTARELTWWQRWLVSAVVRLAWVFSLAHEVDSIGPWSHAPFGVGLLALPLLRFVLRPFGGIRVLHWVLWLDDRWVIVTDTEVARRYASVSEIDRHLVRIREQARTFTSDLSSSRLPDQGVLRHLAGIGPMRGAGAIRAPTGQQRPAAGRRLAEVGGRPVVRGLARIVRFGIQVSAVLALVGPLELGWAGSSPGEVVAAAVVLPVVVVATYLVGAQVVLQGMWWLAGERPLAGLVFDPAVLRRRLAAVGVAARRRRFGTTVWDLARAAMTTPVDTRANAAPGVNDSRFVHFAGGIDGLFKPIRRWSKPWRTRTDLLAHGEVTAFWVDQLLGFDLVPPTVWVVIDGVPGSLQLFVRGEIGANPYRFTAADRARMRVLDYVLYGIDRHGKNYLRSLRDGRPVAIDNGLVLNTSRPIRSVFIETENGAGLSSEVLEEVRRVSPDDLFDLLIALGQPREWASGAMWRLARVQRCGVVFVPGRFLAAANPRMCRVARLTRMLSTVADGPGSAAWRARLGAHTAKRPARPARSR